MFSSLPKLAEKTFIIGYLVPTVAFVLAVLGTFGDTALVKAVFKLVGTDKSFADLTVVVGAVWLLALALMLLNRPIYRLMEGYEPESLTRFLLKGAKAKWTAQKAKLLEVRNRAVRQGAGGGATARYRYLRRKFLRAYPDDENLVLPTRFGNVNRAFETYAAAVHGVEAITIWSRLSAIIPKDFQSVLGDARSQVDCFVNLSFLAACLAVIHLVYWIWMAAGAGPLLPDAAAPAAASLVTFRDRLAAPSLSILVAGVSIIAAKIFYERAIERAGALGEQVKTAFDLYLPKLAEALGYREPLGFAARQAFWRELEDVYSFFKPAPPRTAPPPPAAAPTGPVLAPVDEPEEED